MAVKFKTWRSAKHLQAVRQLPCCKCGARPSNAHHIIGVGNGIMGSKASDALTMPLCAEHHRNLHTHGHDKEMQWEWVAKTLAGMLEHG